MDIYEEKYYVSLAMGKFGGSFASHLGKALAHADLTNTLIIKYSWPELWADYLEMGMRLEGKLHETKAQNL